jgi:Family of unknown function (DUF6090)
MAKLFNKIRKQLVEEKPSASRTGNYLKYAIGEIILVVIGILIALQINNWNEDRKARKQEANFLSEIQNDLDKDAIKLDYINHYLVKRIEFIDTLLTYVRNPNKTMGLDKFGMYVEPLYFIENPTIYDTAFESAKTSGIFNNFKEKDIMKDLTQYYADFIRMETNIIAIKSIIENHLERLMYTLPESYLNENSMALVISEDGIKDFYKKIGSIEDHRNLKIDYEKILQDPRFESYLIGDMERSYNALGKIKTRKQKLLEIKNKIHFSTN